MKKELKNALGLPEHINPVHSKKEANIIVFDDGYVTVSIDPATRKALQVGDRVKNAIKAMLKEGYSVKIQKIEQSEIPFTENEKTV